MTFLSEAGCGKKFVLQSHCLTTQELLFRSKTRLLKDRSLITRDFHAFAYCLFSPIIRYVCPYPPPPPPPPPYSGLFSLPPPPPSLPPPKVVVFICSSWFKIFGGGTVCIWGDSKIENGEKRIAKITTWPFLMLFIAFVVYRSPLHVNAMLNLSYSFFFILLTLLCSSTGKFHHWIQNLQVYYL